MSTLLTQASTDRIVSGMQTLIPLVLLLALAACGGSSDSPRMGVTPDGGACELPKDGMTIVLPVGDSGEHVEGSFVTVCPNDGRSHCLVYNGENCCCP